jgi:hypothetical protein
VGFKIPLKIHSLNLDLNFLPINLGPGSGEHGDCFHREISTREKRYHRKRSPNMSKSSIFPYMKSCSPLKIIRRFGGTCRLHLQDRRMSHSTHSDSYEGYYLLGYKLCSPLKVEFQQTTLHYIPYDRISLSAMTFT